MTPKRRRLWFVASATLAVGAIVATAATVLDDSITYFRTPTEVATGLVATDKSIRLGGLVKLDSVERTGTLVRFVVTDLAHEVPVRYEGALPDLFRPGQGVVVEGRLDDGALRADTVLAKHDENYMPPEVAEALKRSGQWQHYGGAKGE